MTSRHFFAPRGRKQKLKRPQKVEVAVAAWAASPLCGWWRETHVLVGPRPEAQVSPGQAALACGAQYPLRLCLLLRLVWYDVAFTLKTLTGHQDIPILRYRGPTTAHLDAGKRDLP